MLHYSTALDYIIWRYELSIDFFHYFRFDRMPRFAGVVSFDWKILAALCRASALSQRLRLHFLMQEKAATCYIPTTIPIPHRVFLQASHSLLFSTTIALGGFFLLPLPSRCLYLIACSKHSFLTWLFSEVIMRFPPPISLDLRVRQLLPAI